MIVRIKDFYKNLLLFLGFFSISSIAAIPIISDIIKASTATKIKHEISQALDDAGTTMLMLQMFLIFVTLVILVVFLKYFMFLLKKRRLRSINFLLHRLGMEVALNNDALSETVNKTTECLEKRFFSRKFKPEDLRNMFLILKLLRDKNASREQKLLLIDSLKGMVKLL